MRKPLILPWMLGLSLWACGEPVDPPVDPPANGTLVVSTSTSGEDPDPDGFRLRIDGSESLALLPSGTAEVALSPGRHTLQLEGVAEHCSVVPGTSVEVDIVTGRTAPVVFQVGCPLTGARITIMTTGKDIDQDGYKLSVDAADIGVISANGTMLIRLDPGSRTIALSSLAPNCAIDGPVSRMVTITDNEAVPIEFAVVCTGTGTIRLTTFSDVDATITWWGYIPFQVTVDGEVHDIQVPDGVTTSSFVFGGITRGVVGVRARSPFYQPEFAGCFAGARPGGTVSVNTIGVDTAEVKLEVYGGYCFFR